MLFPPALLPKRSAAGKKDIIKVQGAGWEVITDEDFEDTTEADLEQKCETVLDEDQHENWIKTEETAEHDLEEGLDDDENPLLESDEFDAEVQIKKPKSRFGGDDKNIAVLLFLYVLQGIPLGLAAAVPLILTNRNVSYKQQAEFSFAYWPFSVKLLWAPIVDSLFIKRFGRRKTWLVPVQYFIGVTMLLLAN